MYDLGMEFGEKIAELLARQERSQAWLARSVGLTQSAISKILAGGETSFRNALGIAKALGVPVEWLVEDKAEWPPRHLWTRGAMSFASMRERLLDPEELAKFDQDVTVSASFVLFELEDLLGQKELLDERIRRGEIDPRLERAPSALIDVLLKARQTLIEMNRMSTVPAPMARELDRYGNRPGSRMYLIDGEWIRYKRRHARRVDSEGRVVIGEWEKPKPCRDKGAKG